jgi:hypothetical protein
VILLKNIGVLFLLPFALVGLVSFILMVPPTRRLLLMSLGRYYSRLAQQGRFNVSVKSWEYTNASHQPRNMKTVREVKDASQTEDDTPMPTLSLIPSKVDSNPQVRQFETP